VHVGLAQDHGARGAQLLHDGRIGGRHETPERRRAGGGWQSGDVDVVLHDDGHALQRQAGPGGAARVWDRH
jgi:hypothetical protein